VKWREEWGSACMNTANLENISSESNVRGKVRCGKWVRMKAERREMAMTICCGREYGTLCLSAAYQVGNGYVCGM
jgi:hypothetical protein